MGRSSDNRLAAETMGFSHNWGWRPHSQTLGKFKGQREKAKTCRKMYFNRVRRAGPRMRDSRNSFVVLCKKRQLRSSIKVFVISLPSWLTSGIVYGKCLPYFKIGPELGFSTLRVIKMHRKICFFLASLLMTAVSLLQTFWLGYVRIRSLLVGVLHGPTLSPFYTVSCYLDLKDH